MESLNKALKGILGEFFVKNIPEDGFDLKIALKRFLLGQKFLNSTLGEFLLKRAGFERL
mgnify:CR=1 FL=1|tara:strand:- start:762 stop:938 length:177 start_codon:yes stop_codon:yes gene_type:complete